MLRDTGERRMGALGAAPRVVECHDLCRAFTAVHIHDLLERHLSNANMLRVIKYVSCAALQLCKDC